MRESSTPAPQRRRTSLVIISHTSSNTEEKIAELVEKLKHLRAFCRGLDKKEYEATLFDFEKDRHIYIKHSIIGKIAGQKNPSAYPLIFIDEALVWSGTYPTSDELADLLKIGCRDLDNCSDCCRLSYCRFRENE